MTHFLGAVLLIAAAASFGGMRASELRRKPREVRALRDALGLLRSDIVSRALPLPDALAHAAGMSSGRTRLFFLSLSDKLGDSAQSFAALWSAETAELTFLGEQEREALSDLGAHLGRFDAASQARALDACIAALDRCEQTARDDAKQYGRLYTGLGLTVGAMLAVALY